MTAFEKEFRVIDSDTHVVEPYDLWTSRVSVKKWGDRVPHVRWDPVAKMDAWYFGDTQVWSAAGSAYAGWPEGMPSRPPTLKDAQEYTWDAHKRLKLMDDYGIYAEVLYPNVAGIGAGQYAHLSDPELRLRCVEAYNDWLVEWCSADKKRLIPQMAMPLWDVNLCVKEMERAAKLGHKGVVMCGEPEYFGLPTLTDPHWAPLWSAAQDMQLPINFHVATGDFAPFHLLHKSKGGAAACTAAGVTFFLNNGSILAQIICGGICHDYPKLNFVSVESGIGWIPYALTSLDWLWQNTAMRKEHPEWDLLPSEYFKRQCYGCFMHETDTLMSTIDVLGPDNLLFETDFPHATSLTPGPASTSPVPKDYLNQTLASLPKATVGKLIHGNAARIYHLD